MFTIYAFGALLILLAATLMASHWRSWRRVRDDLAQGEMERRFAWRQCRRRLQASAMIGIVGLAMCVYELVPPDEVLVTVYLGGLIVIVLWIMLLAIGDVIETRSHFSRIRREERRAQARLAADLENHREATR